ncbi:thiamine phosphate synthase, partial [Burkholderia cenocepacia]|nr:thiamine phosphate synthase [Burkholderia cenocepacia]
SFITTICLEATASCIPPSKEPSCNSSKENAPITLISTLKTICQTVAIPVVAIGGLTSENIDQLMGTGIAGVAVVRDLMQAEDIEAKTQAFLKKLHNILS